MRFLNGIERRRERQELVKTERLIFRTIEN